MTTRELSLEEKKACIAFMIALLISRTEEFICHCLSEFVNKETEMEKGEVDTPENYMHIIFPELYNQLKSLVENDVDFEKYNANNTRMGDFFEETHKCPVWYSCELDERVHFLNDLKDSLE